MSALRDHFCVGIACVAITAFAVDRLERASPVSAAEPTPAGSQFLLESGTGKFGGPLLFVLDTKSKVLSAYEAEGGTPATRGLTWIGARKIEWDINTTSYNDKSEESYSSMKQRFEQEQARRITGAADDGSGSPAVPAKDKH